LPVYIGHAGIPAIGIPGVTLFGQFENKDGKIYRTGEIGCHE
jgi:hypothetical protein